MQSARTTLRLQNLRCRDEGDGIGSAEPYLWTVFFKIDGDTVVVTSQFALRGTATVVGTPGNHGNLPNHDVDPGEVVPIPAAIGQFNTVVKPIPLQTPVGQTTHVSGAMGCIVVAMEEDNTPNSAVAKGHNALNKAVQKCLNDLIPTLNIGHQEPTPAEIQQIQAKIAAAVKKAIKDDVSVWEWLGGFGNMDDQIGSAVFQFSLKQLLDAGPGGIPFSQRWKNEGDWELTGRVSATPVG